MKGKRFATSLAKANQKKLINSHLAKTGNRYGMALVLDGTTRNTTKALVKDGWKPNKIFIPNNSKDYTYIKRYHNNTFPMSIGEFIVMHRSKINSLGLVYMDYMCAFETVKNDLCNLLNHKMMMDGSALGVTFSINRSLKNNTGFIQRDMIYTISFITELAFDNGYSITMEQLGGNYRNQGSQMYSLIF